MFGPRRCWATQYHEAFLREAMQHFKNDGSPTTFVASAACKRTVVMVVHGRICLFYCILLVSFDARLDKNVVYTTVGTHITLG